MTIKRLTKEEIAYENGITVEELEQMRINNKKYQKERNMQKENNTTSDNIYGDDEYVPYTERELEIKSVYHERVMIRRNSVDRLKTATNGIDNSIKTPFIDYIEHVSIGDSPVPLSNEKALLNMLKKLDNDLKKYNRQQKVIATIVTIVCYIPSKLIKFGKTIFNKFIKSSKNS